MSSDYVHTPCNDSANDPEDWFINRDGLQYPDVALVTEAHADVIVEHATEDGLDPGWALEEMEAVLVTEALVRRRHAKDDCHVRCYFRTQCLELALSEAAPEHGTHGGYYEEELRKIRQLRDRRAWQRSQPRPVE